MAYEEKDGDIKLFVGKKHGKKTPSGKNYPSLEGYVILDGQKKNIAMWTHIKKDGKSKWWSGMVTLEEEEQVRRSRWQLEPQPQTEAVPESEPVVTNESLQAFAEQEYERMKAQEREDSEAEIETETETEKPEEDSPPAFNLSW